MVQDNITQGWFCGAQGRKVFARPEWAILLGLRRLVTGISKVAGGKQANSSFAFTAFRIEAVLLLGLQKLGLDSWPVSTSTKATFVSNP